MKKRLPAFVITFIIWLLLTWPGKEDWQEQVFAGLICSAIVAALLGHIYPQRAEKLLQPKRYLWALVYIPYFIYWCVRANLDVAYRVLHPEMPIRPGIVRVTTNLQTDMAKTFLANSITLTPGTLTVDIIGQDFFVHWIYIPTEDVEEHTRLIVGRFERMLKEIFE